MTTKCNWVLVFAVVCALALGISPNAGAAGKKCDLGDLNETSAPASGKRVDLGTAAQTLSAMTSPFDLKLALDSFGVKIKEIVTPSNGLEEASQVLEWVKANRFGPQFMAHLADARPNSPEAIALLRRYFSLGAPTVVAEQGVRPPPASPRPPAAHEKASLEETIKVVVAAFDMNDLQQSLSFCCGISLGNIVGPGNLREVAGQVLEYLKKEKLAKGWVDYVRTKKTRQPEVTAALERYFGLAPVSPEPPAAESVPVRTISIQGASPGYPSERAPQIEVTLRSSNHPAPPVVKESVPAPVAANGSATPWEAKVDAVLAKSRDRQKLSGIDAVYILGAKLPTEREALLKFLGTHFGKAKAQEILNSFWAETKDADTNAMDLLQVLNSRGRYQEAVKMFEALRANPPAPAPEATVPLSAVDQAKLVLWQAEVDVAVAQAQAKGDIVSQETMNLLLKVVNSSDASFLAALTPAFGDQVAEQMVSDTAGGNTRDRVFNLLSLIGREQSHEDGLKFLKSLRGQKPKK